MTEVWNVIYLWRGERHVAGQYDSKPAAQVEVIAMRGHGFICWAEWVGYREVSP